MITIEKTSRLDDCLKIRNTVFVLEQNVAPELEIDGLDSVCEQFLILLDGEPIGTFRCSPEHGNIHLQRLCILKEHRRKGAGKAAILFAADHYAGKYGKIVLDAQVHAIGFYEKLGFYVVSDEFYDAGIPHRKMEKIL